jgi:protein gp37
MADLPNVAYGVSVEDRRYGLPRLRSLQRTPARIRFLSVEPLLEDLGMLNLRGIEWVIVGGESGSHARPMLRAWVVPIRRACRVQGVPFFFKQWGGVRKHETGRTLDGRTYDEFPLAFDLLRRTDAHDETTGRESRVLG